MRAYATSSGAFDMASMKNSNRYVAHFDMLGMTSAIRKNADEAWGALSDLRKSEKDIVNKYSEIAKFEDHELFKKHDKILS